MLIKPIFHRLNRCCRINLINAIRRLNTEGHHMKTELQLLTREDESNHIYIHGYSKMGFSLSSGTQVFGPIAIFPRNILHWNVKNAESITEESLCLFPMLVPKLDIVVVGTGERCNKVNNKIFRYLKSHGINPEILNTEVAAATFNFLNLERRCVAAALMPQHVDATTEIRRGSKLYEMLNTEEPIRDTLEDFERERQILIEKNKDNVKNSSSLSERFRKYVQEDEFKELKDREKKLKDNSSDKKDK